MKFIYTGTDHEGKGVRKEVEAADRFAVYEIARTAGHRVAGVRKAGGGFRLASLIRMDRINALLSRVNTDTLAVYTRNLSSMLAAGLPLSRALGVLKRQNTNPKLLAVTGELGEQVSKGVAFHEALGAFPGVFSPLYISMVRAGEQSGGLADTLGVLAVQIARMAELKKKVRGAMLYPAIVLIVMAVIGVLMMIYVMPTITSTFRGLDIDLPQTTRILIGASDLFQSHALLLALGAAAALGAIAAALQTKPGIATLHHVLVHMPVIGGIVREINAARTARTLSSLLASGVDIVESIKITGDVVQNVHYKAILAKAAANVEQGGQLSETLIAHTKLYPPLVGEMALVGEETGDIAGMLQNVAEFYEKEVEMKTKDLSTIVEPVLMVVIGGVVGFFALAMIAPIYSISDSIG